MGWRDTILPPSFRGIGFDVEAESLEGGVRGPLHEYPLKDKPFREPMGRKGRVIPITGTLSGDDYNDVLEQLIGALEDGRPGELIHPWFGSLIVSVGTFIVSRTSDVLGQATVDMTFYEVGERTFPSNDAIGPEAVDLTADFVDSSAEQSAIAITDISGRPAWVVAQAEERVASLVAIVRDNSVGPVRTVLTDARALSSGLDSIEDRVDVLAGDLAQQAAAVRDLAENVGDLSPLARTLSRLPLPTSTTAATADAQAAADAVEASTRLWRRTFLAAYARAVVAAAWVTYDDAVRARNQLAARIDEELAATPLDGDVFDALSAMRSAAAADLTERAAQLPQQRIIEVAGDTPASQIAWTIYRDAGRIEELVDRNDIPHPGFISGPLAVLNR